VTKNIVIISNNLLVSVTLFLIHRFILAQNFSMGFKSGEYGGKKISLQPTDSINSFVFFDLWKLALSITTTCPAFNSLIKNFSTQLLNNSVLHVPLKTKGAID